MNKYIELDWVRSDKDIPFPDIIFGEFKEFSGAYYHPFSEYNNRIYKKGLILVNGDDPSTIAHEYRHHWQFYNGIKYDNVAFDYNMDYKKEVIRYYTKSTTEMDALLFEIKKYPDDFNQQIYEWIEKNN